MILLTANRSMKGKDSLEQVMREENTPIVSIEAYRERSLPRTNFNSAAILDTGIRIRFRVVVEFLQWL